MTEQTFLVDLACERCGSHVAELRMVLPRGSKDWFLAPSGTYEPLWDSQPVPPLEARDADRGRFRFRCDCGNDLPATAEKLRPLAEKLRRLGESSVDMATLRRMLSMS
jgi:hypothetical protein